jgi:hypothetical protein
MAAEKILLLQKILKNGRCPSPLPQIENLAPFIPGHTSNHSPILGIVLMVMLTCSIDLAISGVMVYLLPVLVYLFLGWDFIYVSAIMHGLTLEAHG